jgi:alkylation response protein AidB-like acyl-CoA dehydrogenase
VKSSDDDLPRNLAPYIEKIDAFHKAEVAPREKRLEHRLTDSRAYLGDDGRLHPEVQQARREIMKASGAAGLFSLHLPESIGGGGLSRTEMFFIEEKVYSFGVGLGPAILGWTDGSTPRLIYCSEAQRGRFVDPLVRGEKTSCHGVTEPQAGSNLFDMRTNAVRKGSKWVLNGHKSYITNPFEADIVNVLAVTDPGQGTRSFSYFQFEAKDHLGKGFRHGNLNQTMFDDGLTGEFHLEDLALDDDAMLGEQGQGFQIAMASINWTRTRRGGMCSAWSKLLIDRTVRRLKARMVGGKPLGANQGLQWAVADMYTDWYSARATSLACLREIESYGPWWNTKRTPEEIRLFAVIKIVNDEAFYRVADRAVQIHGGYGVLKDNTVNKLFRIARNLRVPGGTDESQRSTIAETLGLHAKME